MVNTQFLYKDLSKIPGMSPQEIVHVWKKKQLNKEEPVSENVQMMRIVKVTRKNASVMVPVAFPAYGLVSQNKYTQTNPSTNNIHFITQTTLSQKFLSAI